MPLKKSHNGVWKRSENDEQEKEGERKTFNESFSCLKMIDDLQLVSERMDGNISLNGLGGKKLWCLLEFSRFHPKRFIHISCFFFMWKMNHPRNYSSLLINAEFIRILSPFITSKSYASVCYKACKKSIMWAHCTNPKRRDKIR